MENVSRLQIKQNFVARIVVGLRKYDHVSPVLKYLHWLNITDQLYLRDAVLVFKLLHHLDSTVSVRKIQKKFRGILKSRGTLMIYTCDFFALLRDSDLSVSAPGG